MLRKTLCWICIGGLSAFGAGCCTHHAAPAQALQAPPPEATVLYNAPKGNFSIRYPSSWKPQEGKMKTMLCLVPVHDNSAGLSVVDVDVPDVPPHLPGLMTMDAVSHGFEDDLKKRRQDVQITSVSDALFPDAKAAQRIQATARDNGQDMVIDTIIAIRDEKVFIISSETTRADADAGRKAEETILHSWHWNS